MMKNQKLFFAGMSLAMAIVVSTGLAAPVKNKNKGKAAPKPSGAPTPVIVIQKMKEFWVKPADPGMDGATTAVFHSVVIGQPRPWTVLDGGNGRPGTKVWPAKVHWTYRTHYRTRTSVLERFWYMSCFKDAFGEWVVQSSGQWKDEIRRDEPSTMQ